MYDDSGELVCLKPFPSMPVSFWNDTDGSLYRKAYFSKFPGIVSWDVFCFVFVGGDFYLVFHCCGQHVNFEGMLSGSYPLGLIG